MDGVRASEGWLHLEVVGSPAAPGPETAAAVAAYLREQGAQHIARGEVWDDRGDARLARDRPDRRPQADRLPAPPVPTRRRPRRRPPRPVRLRPRRPFNFQQPVATAGGPRLTLKKQHPPQPYVQAFVVCREIFEDHHTGEYLLFAPRSAFRLAEFPGLISFAVYAHLTELQGQVPARAAIRGFGGRNPVGGAG